MFSNFFQNLLSGTLSPLTAGMSLGMSSQQATFINPLTSGNKGTAAYGFGQGGMGSSPSFGGQTFSNISGLSGAGGTFTGLSGYKPTQSPLAPKTAASPFGHTRGMGVRGGSVAVGSLGATGLNAGIQGDTTGIAGSFQQRGPQLTGAMAKDAFGRPILNAVNGKPVPSAPQAYRTDPLTGQREYLADANGNPVAQNLTSFQAQQAGLSTEELQASGYTWFAGQWVYNPAGGSGAGGPGGNSNLSWWEKPQSWAGNRSFSSEKEANKAYQKYLQDKKKADEREDPRKNGSKKTKGGAGLTVATSNMGTG